LSIKSERVPASEREVSDYAAIPGTGRTKQGCHKLMQEPILPISE
jgi:hypothetical protein